MDVIITPGDWVEVPMNWVPVDEGKFLLTVEVVDSLPSEVPPISRWYNNFAAKYVEVHDLP